MVQAKQFRRRFRTTQSSVSVPKYLTSLTTVSSTKYYIEKQDSPCAIEAICLPFLSLHLRSGGHIVSFQGRGGYSPIEQLFPHRDAEFGQKLEPRRQNLARFCSELLGRSLPLGIQQFLLRSFESDFALGLRALSPAAGSVLGEVLLPPQEGSPNPKTDIK